MSFTINLLDDATRPKAPRIEGVTPQQRMHGRRLGLYHNMHLQQMAEVRAMMERIAGGEESLEKLGDAVSALQMASNYRRFGNLCGQECMALTFHHSGETEMLFPALKNHSAGLDKVVDRLLAEHEVVHALIERMEAAAIRAIETPGPETFASLRETFEVLERVVKSHFGYEQDELEEAIGYYGVM